MWAATEWENNFNLMLKCWVVDITKSIKFTYHVCISIYLSYIVFVKVSRSSEWEITTFPRIESIWLHQDLAEEGLVGVIGWGLSDEQMLPPFSPPCHGGKLPEKWTRKVDAKPVERLGTLFAIMEWSGTFSCLWKGFLLLEIHPFFTGCRWIVGGRVAWFPF